MLALTAGSPPLPAFIVLPVMALYFLLITLAARRVSAPTSFLIIAFAVRLAMSAQPHLSFSASPAQLSWNALVSVLVVGAGALLMHRSRAVPLILLPLAAMTIVIIASMVLNANAAGAVESLVKYSYFAIIAILAYDAFVADGPARVMSRLLLTFTLPLILQFASLALGIDKATESDGSASYIGGYNHEATFSIILLTALLAALLHPALKSRYKLLTAAICVGGILAANYRTAIIAAAPLLAGLVLHTAIMATAPRQRFVAGIFSLLLMLGVSAAMLPLAADRFEALSALAADPEILSKSPAAFTAEDRNMMSGRLYLWSQYRQAWREGTARQHVLGFGANAWEGRYRYYAHNTLVSTLYELGTTGVAAMLLLWIWMMTLAMSSPRQWRFTLVMAHLGFFLLNMATMPFWMIEGLLYYGLLCGFTVYVRIEGRSVPRPVANRARPVTLSLAGTAQLATHERGL